MTCAQLRYTYAPIDCRNYIRQDEIYRRGRAERDIQRVNRLQYVFQVRRVRVGFSM